MNRVLINLFLVVVLGALVGLHWVILPDPSRRNYEFLPDMMFSVPRDAQTPVGVVVAGVPLDLRPAEGTIARNFMPFSYPATPEGALLAGAELNNPFASDDVDAVTRGEEVFNTYCSVCHGVSGQGDGPVAKRGVPPPPSLLLEHALDMREGQMYHVISVGQGNMAGYSSQVNREDRWRAITHIRRLQAAPTPAPAATEPAAGSPETPAERIPETSAEHGVAEHDAVVMEGE